MGVPELGDGKTVFLAEDLTQSAHQNQMQYRRFKFDFSLGKDTIPISMSTFISIRHSLFILDGFASLPKKHLI